MAISLGTLVVDIIAKTGGFVEGMTKAKVEAKNAARDIQGSFSSLGEAASGLLAPFGEIGGALGEALGGIGNTLRSVTQGLGPLVGGLGLVGTGIGWFPLRPAEASCEDLKSLIAEANAMLDPSDNSEEARELRATLNCYDSVREQTAIGVKNYRRDCLAQLGLNPDQFIP